MGKVGRWITDPKAGAYCTITLDGGEKIVINHDKGGFKGGRLTIERLKLFGFSSDRIFACDLDSQQGKTAVSFLTEKLSRRVSTRHHLERSLSTSEVASRSAKSKHAARHSWRFRCGDPCPPSGVSWPILRAVASASLISMVANRSR
jgi:hypothetical protein